jgi:hypothetical protein
MHAKKGPCRPLPACLGINLGPGPGNALGRRRWSLVLDCILIITSVVPPDLPMQLALAVNQSLLSLQKTRAHLAHVPVCYLLRCSGDHAAVVYGGRGSTFMFCCARLSPCMRLLTPCVSISRCNCPVVPLCVRCVCQRRRTKRLD